MPKWITTETRKWKEVDQGETIETSSGQRFEVLSTRKGKAKGTRTVVIRGKAGTFTKTVESKKKTSVVLTDGKSGGKGVDLERLRAENEEKRRRRNEYGKAPEPEKREMDPWKVDPADTLYAKAEGQVLRGNGGPWDKVQDAAEERAVSILGAKMIGIQKEPGGIYYVPPIDRTTIRAHMYLMHGQDLPEVPDDVLLSRHERDHERPSADLYVPHEHTKNRP